MMMYELFAAKFELKKPNAACSMALTAVRSHRISWASVTKLARPADSAN
jgi:hypothetical protein